MDEFKGGATTRMMILVNKPFSDDELTKNLALDLRNVGPSVWSRLLSKCRATDLRLYHITLKSVDGIESLSQTNQLTLEWATKIENLDSVFRMSQLSKLSVFDFPKLKVLAGIEQLSELTELNLSGSRGAIDPPLRLSTIEPVSRIPNLVSFSLANTRLDDDDITYLSKCRKLRHLSLSKRFDRRQVAFLAKHLNAQLEEPLSVYSTTNLLCKQCGGKKAMFYGHRMTLLCRVCDEKDSEKIEREFEKLVHDA